MNLRDFINEALVREDKTDKLKKCDLYYLKDYYNICNDLNWEFDKNDVLEILGAEYGYDRNDQKNALPIIKLMMSVGVDEFISFLKSNYDSEELEYEGFEI